MNQLKGVIPIGAAQKGRPQPGDHNGNQRQFELQLIRFEFTFRSIAKASKALIVFKGECVETYHGYTLRAVALPNSPCGQNIKIATRMISDPKS